MKQNLWIWRAVLVGLVLASLALTGCSNGGGDDPVPQRGVDFLLLTEFEIETRTADTTEPRQINGVNFVFRGSEFDIVSPLPVKGASLASN